MKSVKHSLTVKLSVGFPDISQMARLCLIPCENEGPWLGLLCEFDFEDFTSETAAVASTSGGPAVSSVLVSPSFPFFETALPADEAPRLVPFKAALDFGAAPFAVAALATPLLVRLVPRDAGTS